MFPDLFPQPHGLPGLKFRRGKKGAGTEGVSKSWARTKSSRDNKERRGSERVNKSQKVIEIILKNYKSYKK